MFRIKEFGDVMVDACVRDSSGHLMFLSAYGRDGALMQLLAALQLPDAERGVRRFWLEDVAAGTQHLVEVGDHNRLQKHTGKLPRQNLFGPVGHLWLYHDSLVQLDCANRIGWVLLHQEAHPSNVASADLALQGWELLKQLSPVPLLEHWREPVWQWCCEARLITNMANDTFYPPLGPMAALRIGLADSFETKISQMVREGLLHLSPLRSGVAPSVEQARCYA